jgi:hypothetical protein
MATLVTRRELRVEMPKVLLEAFAERPRIIVDPAPGLWPIDLQVLPYLDRLLKDKDFVERFEVLIVPR